jgi:hypothetical protein
MADSVVSWPQIVLGSGAVAALVSAMIAGSAAYYGHRVTRELTETRRDLDLVDRFQAVHFSGKDSYRLSVYVVRLIGDIGLKRDLRHFIFWDIMERNFVGRNPTNAFNPDHHDWHLLGDAMFDMKKDLQKNCWDGRDWFRWWTDQVAVADDRWSGTSKVVLSALYAELDKTYFGKGWRTEPRPSCAKW